MSPRVFSCWFCEMRRRHKDPTCTLSNSNMYNGKLKRKSLISKFGNIQKN